MNKNQEFNLATANGREMKTWAANNIDLRLSLSMSEDTMRKKIVERCEQLGVPVPKAEVAMQRHKPGLTYYVINIPKQDRPGGDEPAFVGVQGVGYLIPRNINVTVPSAVVEVLRNGVQDIVTQEEDGDLNIDQVPTYPFQVVDIIKPDVAA